MAIRELSWPLPNCWLSNMHAVSVPCWNPLVSAPFCLQAAYANVTGQWDVRPLRTLALTLYGDLDVSIIDQLPPGRQKIITRWRTGARRNEAMTTILHEIADGHQAFIICPLIEESESIAAKAATVEYERLQREV